jgi:CspA family cold shock protein
MPYRDTWSTCSSCGREFLYRVEEQRQQAREGKPLQAPLRCPSCSLRAQVSKPTVEASREPDSDLGPGPHEGTVKWYSSEKGYGFIYHPGGTEVFFHSSGIMPGEDHSFPDGSRVTYLLETTEKGPQAIDVAKMDSDRDPAAQG